MSETGPGALIDDRYRLGESLGQGGMSRVFRAVDEALGREVALKLLREPLVQHTGRFEREARTMGRLRHPTVVKVYGYGLTRGDDPSNVLPYLVLELVDDAVSLMAHLEAHGPLSADEAVRMMRPIAGALAEAHGVGIVHRDLKPENILIQRAPGLDPQLRLLDFGIAAWDEPTAQRLTRTGQIFGTPAYMAPEHATGQFGAGPTADVWSLGVMLHEMVSGECPFRGPHVTATLFNITNKPAPPLDGAPEGFRALVDACLEKDHEVRLPDAAAVLERLDALAAVAEPRAVPRPAVGTDPTVGMQASGELTPDPDLETGPTAEAPLAPVIPPAPEAPRREAPRTEPGQTAALAIRPPIRRWLPTGVSALVGLAVGIGVGLSIQRSAQVGAGAPLAAVSASPDAEDAGRPSDAGPPPLIDPALAAAVTFLDSGDAERAAEWLAANPDAGHPDARRRLEGLVTLARGEVGDALEILDPLLTRRPDLARDVPVREALMGLLGERRANGLVDLMAVMLEVDPSLEERLYALTDHDEYRTRRRAFRIIEQAGVDVEAAALKYYVRNLRLIDCDMRRHAVDRLRALGDPEAIGPIRRMEDRTGFFDNLCMDDAVERALGTLYAAQRRAARAAAAAEDVEDAGPPDAAAPGTTGSSVR